MRLALFAFIGALLAGPAAASVCSTLPYTLTNGQTADATQVMANFNALLACLNNNVALAGNNTNITALLGLTTPLSQAQGGTGGTSAVNSFNGRSGSVTLTGADINTALGYTPASLSSTNNWSAIQTFSGSLEAQTLAGQNFGVRIRGESGGNGILQFTDVTAGTEWATIIATAANINIGSDAGSVTLNGLAPIFASHNLSDLTSAATARSNLGLTSVATASVGTTAGTVAAGNDARFATRWANVSCTSGGCTLNSSLGVSSVTRTAQAQYTVNFSPAAVDGSYVAVCSTSSGCFVGSHSAGSVPVVVGSGTDSPFDIVIFGN